MPQDHLRHGSVDVGALGPVGQHDEGGAATRRYGLMHEEDGDEVAVPATIVIDASGRVRWFHIRSNVRDRPAPAEVLDVLRGLES